MTTGRRGLSLELKLPLLISALLVVVIGGFSWAAYREVRRSALAAGAERLAHGSQQLKSLLGAGGPQHTGEVRAVAAQPALRALLGHASEATRAAGRQALQALTARDSLNAAAEVWDAAGKRLLAVGRPLPALDTSGARALSRLVSGAAAAIGTFRMVGDSAYFPVLGTVGDAAAPAGYVVIWRWVTASPGMSRQLAALIGEDAAFEIGNAAGDVWVDLSGPVEGPPGDMRGRTEMIEYQRRDGTRYLARATPMAGAPWLLVVEFPRDQVLGRARTFLKRIAAIALVLIGAGAVGAGAVSRQITRPLRVLNEAAQAIAANRPPPQVDLARPDELGRLARSFNTMATEVAHTRADLEGEVAARTQELEEAHRLLEQSTKAQLGATEARLEHVLASSNALLYAVTVAGETLVPRWVSENITRLLGYDAEQALAANWWPDHVHPEDRARVVSAIPSLVGQGQLSLEYRFAHKDGTYRWIRDEWTLIRNAHGKPVEAIGTWIDVTARKQLEAQFLQAQKMEAVGRLAGGIAHDFNNLLTAILGTTDLLLEDLDTSDPRRQDLEEIKQATRRAAELTHQLLAFSRQQLLEPRVLDLNEVIQSLHKMLRRLIGEDVELVTVSGRDLGTVRADPGQLEQVIVNLAVNARDAMPDGGKLTIETANAELDEAYAHHHVPVRPGAYVMLAVSDTGVGMDAATKARIFEPFFTTKERGKGTGLGLATVYGIVKQSGGYIWVYSEPRRGTSFKIYLPRVHEPAQPVRAPAAPASLRGSETVLLAEDEEIVRKLVGKILESRGYTVLVAESGAVALAIAEGHTGPIHLLLTDVVMPGMNGSELAGRLVARRPGTRVLYLSGYTDEAIARHGVLEPGVAFVQKPFTPDGLARKVREVLDAS